MSDSMITLQGWVGSEPVVRQAGQAVVANFRLASTPRRFNRSAGEWVDDGVTQWFTVNAWRQLGTNVKASLRKGDPVVVHGRLVARSWLNQGVETSAFEIEAAAIGHDLTKGCSLLQRNPRPTAVDAVADWRGPAASGGAAVEGPPMWGAPGVTGDGAAATVTTPEPEPDEQGEQTGPDESSADPWAEEMAATGSVAA